MAIRVNYIYLMSKSKDVGYITKDLSNIRKDIADATYCKNPPKSLRRFYQLVEAIGDEALAHCDRLSNTISVLSNSLRNIALRFQKVDQAPIFSAETIALSLTALSKHEQLMLNGLLNGTISRKEILLDWNHGTADGSYRIGDSYIGKRNQGKGIFTYGQLLFHFVQPYDPEDDYDKRNVEFYYDDPEGKDSDETDANKTGIKTNSHKKSNNILQKQKISKKEKNKKSDRKKILSQESIEKEENILVDSGNENSDTEPNPQHDSIILPEDKSEVSEPDPQHDSIILPEDKSEVSEPDPQHDSIILPEDKSEVSEPNPQYDSVAEPENEITDSESDPKHDSIILPEEGNRNSELASEENSELNHTDPDLVWEDDSQTIPENDEGTYSEEFNIEKEDTVSENIEDSWNEEFNFDKEKNEPQPVFEDVSKPMAEPEPDFTIIPEPEATIDPEVSFDVKESLINMSENNKITLDVSTKGSDRFYVEVFDKDGNPVEISDPWNDSVLKREYNRDDFFAADGSQPDSLFTDEKNQWNSISLELPKDVKAGEYTVKVSAVNESGGQISEWTSRVNVSGAVQQVSPSISHTVSSAGNASFNGTVKQNLIINDGNSRLVMDNISTSQADRIVVEVLDKNNNPVNVSDQWVGSVTKREYSAGDFYSGNIPESLNTDQKPDVNSFSLNIPEGLKEGNYTVRVTAVNDANPAANTTWTQQFNVYDSSVKSGYVELPDKFIEPQPEGSNGNYDTKCTLHSANAMVRSYAYRNGSTEWETVDRSSTLDDSNIWTKGKGLNLTAEYNFGSGNKVEIKAVTEKNMTATKLKELLDQHPEGIEIYDTDKTKMHAIFVTKYEGNTFYCMDPAPSYAGKGEIPLTESSIAGKYNAKSQDEVLNTIDQYWYVTNNSKIVA